MKYLKYIDKNVSSQTGKVFLITGANGGLGYETTKYLAYKGAKVIMACRNLEKASIAKEEILKEIPDAQLEIIQYDQASFSSIEEFANKIKDFKIDGLLLNAGTFHPKNGLRTADGYPLTVGTNYIGAYYLINKLDESLKIGNIKRVAVVSSLVHVLGKTKHYKKYLLDVDNKPFRTYNISKRMNYHLAANLKEKYPELEVVLSHPGIADTNIISQDTSSFKKWFAKLSHRFLKIFANPKEKSAICGLFALAKDVQNPLDFYFPRSIFHFAGYPKKTHLNVKKVANSELENVTKEILNIR